MKVRPDLNRPASLGASPTIAAVSNPSRCLLAAFVLLSCDDVERECLPGDYAPCSCDDGEAGYALCDDAGAAYGTCGYCGSSPDADGGGGAGEGGAGGAALLPFMSECDEDAQCDTGICHPFNAKGPHCSHACELAEDCEPPSPGCNGMGICKVP